MNEYEFVVVRYVHDLVANESINVGIVLLDATERRVHVLVNRRYERATRFFQSLNADRYSSMLQHLQLVLETLEARVRDAVGSQFEHLAALIADVFPDAESSFHVSQVGSGLSADPHRRARELFDELVLRQEPQVDARPELPAAAFSAGDLRVSQFRFQPHGYQRSASHRPIIARQEVEDAQQAAAAAITRDDSPSAEIRSQPHIYHRRPQMSPIVMPAVTSSL